ncbi:MAG: sensor domain-containing phosphodiesterase [Janthinobacterium lividum]
MLIDSIAAKLPQRAVSRQEAARLAALYQLEMLDTSPNECFDRLTRMAAKLFNLPIAAIALVDHDRQWLKSRVGVSYSSLPRYKSPCGEIVETAVAVVVPDLLEDAHYRDSHLAQTGVRFYAGAPLVTIDGFCIGSLCVMGHLPRPWNEGDAASLRDLAAMVMVQIELHKSVGRVNAMSRLPNRSRFIEDFQDLKFDTHTGERRFAVMIEIANAAQLNTTERALGSLFLDQLSGRAGRVIQQSIGPGRTAYHVAPSQFVFLAPRGVTESDYRAVLEEALINLEEPNEWRFLTTTVIGVAPFVVGVTEARDVLRMAHSAVQDAAANDLRVSFYSDIQDAAFQRQFTLQNDFAVALRDLDQLRLVYQPRMDLRSRTCVAVEALLRWTHPRLGEISPGEFIPIVERTSMAKAMTAWVLDSALKQLSDWRDMTIPIRMSVNISTANLIEADLPQHVREGLARHGLDSSLLELEVTESAIMDNPAKALATLEAIAAMGVTLSVDDFGTGHSSLAYLQRLPVQVVKIDQSFMRNLDHDQRKRALVSTMIGFTHDLGYRVVVEGIETASSLAFVELTACDEAQGYLFGRPMAPGQLEDWIALRERDTAALLTGK